MQKEQYPNYPFSLVPSNAQMDADVIRYNQIVHPGQVAAIYRVGSRVDGTPRPDSDHDYLILLDSDTHYHQANTSTVLVSGISESPMIYKDEVVFTRKDLEDPAGMEGLETKLIFLFGKDRGRRLIFGEDVFDRWLSPDIGKVFEENGITPKRVGEFKAARRSLE